MSGHRPWREIRRGPYTSKNVLTALERKAPLVSSPTYRLLKGEITPEEYDRLVAERQSRWDAEIRRAARRQELAELRRWVGFYLIGVVTGLFAGAMLAGLIR